MDGEGGQEAGDPPQGGIAMLSLGCWDTCWTSGWPHPCPPHEDEGSP